MIFLPIAVVSYHIETPTWIFCSRDGRGGEGRKVNPRVRKGGTNLRWKIPELLGAGEGKVHDTGKEVKMSKGIWFIGFTIFIELSLAQPTLLYENFDGAWSTTVPPAGWTIVYNPPADPNDWHRMDWSIPGGTYTPAARLYTEPEDITSDILISPAIDCRGIDSVVLHVYTGFVHLGDNYTARLEGSVDYGVSYPYTVRDYRGIPRIYGPETFNISAWAKNQPGVRLRWYFNGPHKYIDVWWVDSVKVVGYRVVGIIEKSEGPTSPTCWLEARPNPTYGRACINYHVPTASWVTLTIYDITGKPVVELISWKEYAGYRTVIWDGINSSGHRVAQGIYFIALRTSSGSITQKLLLLR